jgi:hypothetical protein
MKQKRAQFLLKGFDEKAYQRYFHQHQAEYIRKKLRALKLYQAGKTLSEIAKHLSIHEQGARK